MESELNHHSKKTIHALNPQSIKQHGNRILLISTYSPRLHSEGIKEREREQDITRTSLNAAQK